MEIARPKETFIVCPIINRGVGASNDPNPPKSFSVAHITQLRTCVIEIVHIQEKYPNVEIKVF